MGSEGELGPAAGQIVIYQDGATHLQVRVEGRTVWLTQAGMAELFQTTVPNVNIHLKNVYEEGELDEAATIKEYLIVRSESAREQEDEEGDEDEQNAQAEGRRCVIGHSSFPRTPSFPRTRESSLRPWPPAFAGVTETAPATTPSKKKIKVPDACAGVGVKSMTPYALPRLQGVRFVLGGTVSIRGTGNA